MTDILYEPTLDQATRRLSVPCPLKIDLPVSGKILQPNEDPEKPGNE